MAFIIITILLDMAGIGLAIPVTPALVAGLVGGDLSEASIHLGTMSAIYTAAMFVFAPLLGALSDRFGRKPVLLATLAISAVAYVWTAFAGSLVALFAARALAGLGGASMTVAQTYIADISTDENRAKNFGMIGAAFGAGFIIGPAIGGLLGTYGVHVPFLFAGAIAAANCLYGAFVVPESHARENRRALNVAEANPLGWIVTFRRHPEVRNYAMALVWVWMGHQCLVNTWILYTTYRFNWGPPENGASLAVVGISSAIIQGALIGRMLAVLGEKVAVVGGLLWTGAGLIAYGLAPNGTVMYVLIVISAFGGIAGPTLQGIVARQVTSSEQGAVQGALTSLMSVTGIIGPLIANNLFAHFTAANAPLNLPGVAFFLGGACTIVGAFWSLYLLNGKKEAPAVNAAGA